MGTPVRKAPDDAAAETPGLAARRALRGDLDPLILALARAVSRQDQARPQTPDTDRAG